MPVVAVNLVHEGRTGAVDRDGNREYQSVYQVEMDTNTRGPNEVLNAAGLPKTEYENEQNLAAALGDFYDDPYTDGDTDNWFLTQDGFAIIDNKQAERWDTNTISVFWRVTVTWRWVQIDHRWYASIVTTGRKIPVDDAVYIPDEPTQPESVFIPGRMNGEPGPVCSSANEIYDPRFEKDDTRQVLRLSRMTYTPTATIFDYRDTINSDRVRLRVPVDRSPGWVPAVQEYIFEEKQLKCSSVQLLEQRGTSSALFRESWEFQVNRDTWDELVMDQGTLRLARPTDPDARNGTISAGDVIQGRGSSVPILGEDGRPIAKPVPLNGVGQPQKQEDGNEVAPQFGRWQFYDPVAMQVLPFFEDPAAP